MDLVLKGPVLVEERDGGKLSKISAAIASERSSTDTTSRPSSSNTKDSISTTQDDRLESTKAEMGEVREENERLKTILAQIVEDYQSLQMHFFDIVKQEHVKKPIEAQANAPNEEEKEEEEEEEPELVSLSLGTSSSGQLKKEEKPSKINPKEKHELEEGLSLALDCKFEGSSNGVIEPITSLSPENSFNEAKEEEAGEPWPPSKTSKNMRNSSDDVSQPPHAKKARVSVRARCDAPTMNDGCQWRKYGQKIAKGNPCPRAYYRCTVAPACPVRKQVQRCAEDMSILITTYEGTHNHPLPISATAMASTTSAAACMLTAGSSASRAPTASLPPSAASNSSLTALNFGLTDNSKPTNFYLPSTCMTPSPSNPTITLDLTAPSSFSSSPQQFNRFSSSFTSNPTYSSTWSSGYSGNYGAQSYNTSQFGSLSLARQAQSLDPSYRPYLNKLNNQPHSTSMSNSLTDTIAKAITSDPSFQSALAAAITSYVGSQGTQSGLGQGGKLGEVVPYLAAALASNGCGSTFLTRTDSLGSNTKQANMTFSLQPSLGFSGSKSASTSSVETREKIN